MKPNLLISLVALACLLVVPAAAQVNYEVSGDTAYVAASPNASGNIVIASTYNGYPVISIGVQAFAGCTSLTGVTIPDSVTSIGKEAFFGCISLAGVTIPDSVTSIGNEAFYSCISLAGVTIPKSVTSIAEDAFRLCTSLMNLSVDAANPGVSSLDGILFNKAQTTLIVFPAGRGGSYLIPNSVTNIGTSAFYGCTSLTSVTIPDSVTSFGNEAFRLCTSLMNLSVDASNPGVSSLDGVLFNKAQTTLILFPAGRGGSYLIPNSVTNIGTSAFFGCTSLTSVTIPNSVTGIGLQAFYGCAGLTSMTIADSVTSIGGAAFAGCASLTSVTIPNSVSRIGGRAFQRCTSLVSLTIPNSIASIEPAAFYECTSLTGVFIPNSVTSVGEHAFYRCESLASVLIPNSVTSIGRAAFSGCTNLTSLTFQGNAPLLSGGFGFENVGAGAKVYYSYGTTGWASTYGGLPAIMRGAPAPQVGNVSERPGGFGFTLTGVVNQTIVVEASTDLATWQGIWTHTLSGTSVDFVDPDWLNHPSRLYRARSE